MPSAAVFVALLSAALGIQVTQPTLLQTVYDASTKYKDRVAPPGAYYERYLYAFNCPLTVRGPQRTDPLQFCNFYNDKACCTPLMDLEILGDITGLLNTGVACRARDEIRNYPISRIYCLSCNPELPMYVRNEPYAAIIQNSPMFPRNQTVMICKEWAQAAFNHKTVLDDFDECGLDPSAPCVDAQGNYIPGRNRWVCGDNKIYPSTQFGTDPSTGLPLTPTQSVEAFLNFENMQAPNIDTLFGFKLVSNKPCATMADAMVSNPDCLRTLAQVQAIFGTTNAGCSDPDFTVENPGLCGPVHAEFCYAGSSASAPFLSAVALLACALALVAAAWL